ncbi:hypothetical protein Nwi_2404 [Nitrobacter winogradskyi Nb-255]|uniref:Capsule polysaccharide biosynthesis n=1 Tax=Nitrobacter winogradskyi (strain ATCC 25391 / DSM 10237 / CIP 104748 / NCIMB 11846 / Nb-255) TaxID=323098 RepID=Q3SPY3_NITWN|nr:hypothetical protein Nwi_2404 [Nitrobacter winogradskyi Nb-255]
MAAARARFGDDGCAEIILRCRSLRSLDPGLAIKMIGGMALAIEKAFDHLDPRLVLTFTMDRYVMDVMERVARKREIDFIEMTTSIIPDQVMFLRRGKIIPLKEPTSQAMEAATTTLCHADFAPTYVSDTKKFSLSRFWRIYAYFALRGAYFNALRFLRRDPLNIHYIDALKSLRHKPRLRDVAVLSFMNPAWEARMRDVPRDRRVFLGLQLFPEASMDYWLNSQDMLQHDNVIVRYCEVLGGAGYHIYVKDHPLQFGFRQRGLMQRLSKLPSVTLVPYDVPAGVLIGQCAVSITFTGTIGFQAAIAGLCSVVTEPYYADERHYLHVRSFREIDDVAERIAQWSPPPDLSAARREMIRHLVAASVEGDYFTWRKFDRSNQAHRDKVQPLVRSLNRYLPRFLKPKPPYG